MSALATPMESALLLIIPEAESVVGAHRAQHDGAARAGVPAHITVSYPFKPLADLDVGDMNRLRVLFSACPAFTVELASTGWFGPDLLFLDPRGAGPIVHLTRQVEALFPDYPIYGGEFEDIHPHLTVAHGCGIDALRHIEGTMLASLPVVHHTTAVELWSGPAFSTRQPGWHRVEGFPLGHDDSVHDDSVHDGTARGAT